MNPVLRGWCNYFRHGASTRTFSYLERFAFRRVLGWLRKRHAGLNKHTMVRRLLHDWRIRDGVEMFRPNGRDRAIPLPGHKIPTPWTSAPPGSPAPVA